MDISLNWWAVLAGGALHWVLGAFWYSPLLFARPWAATKGIDMENDEDGGSVWMYLSGLLAGMLLAAAMAVIVGLANATTFGSALILGVIVWAGFNGGPGLANAMFGGSLKLWLIDSSYPLTSVVLISLILTIWV
ncbi:MAG: DUF1761 domain-containing protein [Spirochaetaceae bacterium]|nr:MAG: DUF1761 domain-containing protein [Spirochaetaceae bacterium]